MMTGGRCRTIWGCQTKSWGNAANSTSNLKAGRLRKVLVQDGCVSFVGLLAYRSQNTGLLIFDTVVCSLAMRFDVQEQIPT